ncbi:hypothetical protein GGF50DRAFT_112355 [Schizophyllum commune]
MTRPEDSLPLLLMHDVPLDEPPGDGKMAETSYFTAESHSDSESSSATSDSEASSTPGFSQSSKIFSRAWFRNISQRYPRPRMLYIIAAILTAGFWIGIIFIFANDQLKEDLDNWQGDSDKFSGDKGVEDLWFLQGKLLQFDTDKRRLG